MASQGKIFLLFLQDILKASLNENLTHRCTETGQFFAKLGYFLPIFKKDRGNPPCMVDSAKFHFRLQKAQFHMAISCHIGVIDNGRNRYRIIEYWRTKTTLHVHGVNKSRKIIAFSHLNSTNFKDNFVGEKVKTNIGRINPLTCIICVFHHLYVWEESQIAF